MRKLSDAGLSPIQVVPPLILSFTLAVCLKQIAQAAVSQDDPRVVADISNNPLECLNGFDLAQTSRYAGLLRARSLAIPSFFEIKESDGVRKLSEKNRI